MNDVQARTDRARLLVLADLGGDAGLAGGLHRLEGADLSALFTRVAPTLTVHIDGAEHKLTPRCLEDFGPVALLDRLGPVAEADRARLLDAVLHDPRLLALEAAWRGLAFVASRIEGSGAVVDVLDARRADCVARFRREVFDDEYQDRSPIPLSLIVADFEFTHGPNDLKVLEEMGALGNALSVPWIVGGSPELFGIRNLFHLAALRGAAARFEDGSHASWRRFQTDPSSRWICVAINRFLPRPAWVVDSIGYREAESPAHPEWRCWTRPGWAAAAAYLRSLAKHGHAADLDGLQACGDFTDLPCFPYPVAVNKAEPAPVECLIPDEQARTLLIAGVSPLVGQKGAGRAYFPYLANLHRSARGKLLVDSSLVLQLLSGDAAHRLLRAVPGPPGESAEELAARIRTHLRAWLRDFTPEPSEESTDVQVTESEAGRVLAVRVTLPIRVHGREPEFNFELPLGAP